jgi:hypothetical protein
MKLEDFWGCLEALTACIGNGRTVHLPGREYTRVTKKAALSNYKGGVKLFACFVEL